MDGESVWTTGYLQEYLGVLRAIELVGDILSLFWTHAHICGYRGGEMGLK